jgi:hypothetical protein
MSTDPLPTLEPSPMRATELLDRLRRHYIKPGEALPGGVFLPEVTHGTIGGRRVDALYVGFTSSRGHHLVGHELKVSRADWLHELDQLEKAETWASQCHAWYLVVPDLTIARVEELPHGWGLLVVDPKTKTRLRVVERALVHPDRQPSWDTTHSILKRMDTLRANAISEARHKILADVENDMNKLRTAAAEARRDGNPDELHRLRRTLAEVAEILGYDDISPSNWGYAEGTITTFELRTSFARFLHADRDATRALKAREGGVSHLIDSLERAVRRARVADQALTDALDSPPDPAPQTEGA